MITSGGNLIEGLLTGGEVHDEKVAEELVEAVMSCAVIADRGYAGDGFCRELEGNNNEVVIPGGKNRKEAIVYGQEKYKKCGLIERLFGKIKEKRRLTVRHEK